MLPTMRLGNMQLSLVRERFAPIQPFCVQSGSGVVYREARPAPGVADFIHCYWHLATDQPLETAFIYRVAADGCMDLFAEHSAPDQPFVMGFSAAYTAFPLGHAFRYTGIRFYPGMFPLLFRTDASALAGQAAPLAEVLPRLAADLGRVFGENQTEASLEDKLNQLFIKEITRGNFLVDRRLYAALGQILESSGTLPVQGSLDTGISPRQLRRLFEVAVGDTPKVFSRVVRFQQALKCIASGAPLPDSYYDQAHLIREFRQMYGSTPGAMPA